MFLLILKDAFNSHLLTLRLKIYIFMFNAKVTLNILWN